MKYIVNLKKSSFSVLLYYFIDIFQEFVENFVLLKLDKY